MQAHRRNLISLAAGIGFWLASASPGLAQAWLPPKGEAWATFDYSNLFINRHYWSDGSSYSAGEISSNTYLTNLGYSITDRLGVTVALPYADAKYDGKNPHLLPTDGGERQGSFTDFHLEARYNVFSRSAALTPFVTAILPSHHYEYFGHAVVGMDLKQFLVGTGFGFRSDSFLPKAYVVGRCSYAFVERVADVWHDRGNLDLQLGYNVTPALQVFGLGTGQYTFGGVPQNLPAIRSTWSAETLHHHAQTGKSELLGFGGGLEYQLTGTIAVGGSYLRTVWGRSDHAVHSLFNVAVTFGFSPRQVIRKMGSKPAAPRLAPVPPLAPAL
jgi:hypothetical protein